MFNSSRSLVASSLFFAGVLHSGSKCLVSRDNDYIIDVVFRWCQFIYYLLGALFYFDPVWTCTTRIKPDTLKGVSFVDGFFIGSPRVI